MTSNAGPGRLYVPDERDKNYPMQAVLRASSSTRSFRYWNAMRWWGDQGGTSMCVPYSWTHWAERPNTRTTPWLSQGGHVFDYDEGRYTFRGQQPVVDLDNGYNWMQRNDYWPGENYEGTSVRAGAQYLQQLGLVSSYYWAYDVTTIAQAIMEHGPVVVGTNWTMDMFVTDSKRFISPTGESAGGHAYLLDGVAVRNRFFRIKNSWGRNWGFKGFAKISFDDLQFLLDDYGEACLATP